MPDRHARAPGFVGRFLGSWELALGELAIIFLGVLIALWADQAIQVRQEGARAVSYLERLQEDVSADIDALRFSSNAARDRLVIIQQVDAWLHDSGAMPDPDSLVSAVHYAGVTVSPSISRFTIEELQSTGDLRLLTNDALKRQIADYYNQIELQIENWIAQSDELNIETYFTEVAFVLDPELRLLATTLDPALLRRLLNASPDETRSLMAEFQEGTPDIGATRADASRILDRMRTRPEFEGYLRNSMYWAHLTAQLLDGVVLSAEDLEAAIGEELERLN